MIALRATLFMILAIVITTPAGLLVVLAFMLPAAATFAIIAAWRTLFMALVKYVLGIDYRVIGRENIPGEPSIVLSKHQSAWETVALQEIFAPHRMLFVLKKELLKLPVLGWAFASMKMISIDRTAGKDALAQVAAQGRDRLARGFWVVVFPEGTRVAPGQKKRFKVGGAHLAVNSGAKVVPVAHNAGECWPRNAFLKRPGMITVSIGPAIDPAGLTVDQLNLRVEAWIESEMRRLSPHLYPHVDSTSAAA